MRLTTRSHTIVNAHNSNLITISEGEMEEIKQLYITNKSKVAELGLISCRLFFFLEEKWMYY